MVGDQGKDALKPQTGPGKGEWKSQGKVGGYQCRYFISDGGCKKGADCQYNHDGNGIEKRGRCWGCGAVSHTKKDCPVKPFKDVGGGKGSSKGEGKGKAVKKVEVGGGGGEEKVEAQTTSATPSVASSPEKEKSEGGESMAALVKEAAGLLKSLRGPSLNRVSGPSLNRVQLSNKRGGHSQPEEELFSRGMGGGKRC